MAGGVVISRHLVFVLNNGAVVMDWGNRQVVDLQSGEFMQIEEANQGYPVSNEDLEVLKRMGRVADYDSGTVTVVSMPNPPVSAQPGKPAAPKPAAPPTTGSKPESAT